MRIVLFCDALSKILDDIGICIWNAGYFLSFALKFPDILVILPKKHLLFIRQGLLYLPAVEQFKESLKGKIYSGYFADIQLQKHGIRHLRY